LKKASDFLVSTFQLTNYDMLHLEETVVSYVAYTDGLRAFLEKQFACPVDLNTGVSRIVVTTHNLYQSNLNGHYQMIESSKKVEKPSPQTLQVTQTRVVGDGPYLDELFSPDLLNREAPPKPSP
jgi:hypothetical protein